MEQFITGLLDDDRGLSWVLAIRSFLKIVYVVAAYFVDCFIYRSDIVCLHAVVCCLVWVDYMVG